MKDELKKIKRKISAKQYIFLLVIILAFVVGLILSVFIFNKQQRSFDNHFEVTFIDSHQAIVFWTSEKESIGFVKYGENKTNLSKLAEQTSDKASKTHAVLLSDIPLEGFYLSLHSKSDSLFLFPEIRKINFDPTQIN